MSMLPAGLLAEPGEVTPEPARRTVLNPRTVLRAPARHFRNACFPAAMLSAAFIMLIVLVAIAAPLLTKWSGWDPLPIRRHGHQPRPGRPARRPWGGISAEHWFGVEPQSGRDIFARIVYGARVSLTIAFAAAAITTIIGVVLGMLAGFFGGWVDQVISPRHGLPDGIPVADLHDRAAFRPAGRQPAGAAGHGPVHLRLALHRPRHPRADHVAGPARVRRGRAGLRRQQGGDRVQGDPAQPHRNHHRPGDARRFPATSAPKPRCPSWASAWFRRPRPGAR